MKAFIQVTATFACNINHFYDYWDWCQENGIKARTRMEAEDAHPLDKDDTNIGMNKYEIKELNLTNEFNDFFKFLNTEIIRNYTKRVPHVYHPVAHEAKIQNTHPGQGYHVWHCEWTNDLPRRVLAWALFLNDVDEGGELEFLDNQDEPFFAPKQKGTIVVFDSRVKHRVREVTSGLRKSIVGWVVGPRWK